jgi:hydroxymethylpyrimidine pyrophosphatase-like HAD family hydrolase
LCVFDIDWVLETRSLGFPGITPAGAFALHALAKHGYRVALASGRSAGEVRERCRAYHLIGGVAEYGAFAYETASDQVRDLLSRDDRERLSLVREGLDSAGAIVDPAYEGAVRAYRFDDAGRRRGLLPETIVGVLGADKGAGLCAFLNGRGVEAPSIALAVGDSAEDVPTMKLARLAMAPANADSAVRAAGIRIARSPNQLGAAQAVEALIGHAPGSCTECAPTHLTARSRLLLAALAAQDVRRFGKAVQALRLASGLARYKT